VTTSEEEYTLVGPEADGRGLYLDNGFIVKAGSLARKELAPSGKSVSSVHQRLIDEGVLVEHGSQLRFKKDHLFRTPSGAAAAVLGRTANGWISWKRTDGQTLSETTRVSRDGQLPLLSESKRQQIIERHQELVDKGTLPTFDKLAAQYALFKQKFGPAALSGLDGEALLTFMHDHGDKNSLVYWLEFKDDEEFNTRAFGSIAGGSALKFRVFRRKETGNWQAGSEVGNKPQDITKEEAIEYARSHREQLLKGVELLDALPANANDEEYAQLQDQLDEVAPDVSRLAFGHKYFSLLFPDKLDDYHSPDLQRFHLLKLLQQPPDGDGRYVCAGRFIAAAKEVNLPINLFTATLNAIHGSAHRYWRIGTTTGANGVSFWPMMLERSCIAIGWPKIGEISWVDGKKESIGKLKQILSEVYPNDPKTTGRDASQLAQFGSGIKEGDIVLTVDGMTILGVGKVVGGYDFESEFEFPHQRQVKWLTEDEWQLPIPTEGMQSTVRELGKHNQNLLAIEQHILTPTPPKPLRKVGRVVIKRAIRLNGIPGRIQSVLDRKSQVVLYGPPGTGKTFWAEHAANDLASLAAFGKLFQELNESERTTVHGEGEYAGLVRLCCFHPAYGYEDFLEGYRPKTVNGQVAFELRDGVFKRLCSDAIKSPDQNFYLIIDEINRGDIPRIFGELLTTLEKDKRGKRIILPVSQEVFSIPKNVFLVGTMNTADRSISLLDAALRRRFGFVELMPDGSVLKDFAVAGIALKAWFDALNTRIRDHVGRDARNLQIGHSYLMQGGSPLKDIATLKRAIRDDIIPLLEEYCYEDYGTLAKILGEQIVDLESQRIRQELFDDGQEDALVQGLLAPFVDIATSSEALSTDESQSELEEDEETDS
jgi:5-methylcytosine-specific restriction protein B